jgi:hypothetical protein
MASRSGRFKRSVAAGAQFDIIQGRSDAMYRILNSGPNELHVDPGHGPAVPLAEGFSIDVAVSNTTIKIINPAGDAKVIEGIYEYLDGSEARRSGRFKLEAATAAHPIIRLTPGGPAAYYRVYNSGDAAFSISKNGALITDLDPEQSFDFDIAKAGGAMSRQITIASGGPADGIYELLGLFP